jgi:hypothetical protein
VQLDADRFKEILAIYHDRWNLLRLDDEKRLGAKTKRGHILCRDLKRRGQTTTVLAEKRICTSNAGKFLKRSATLFPLICFHAKDTYRVTMQERAVVMTIYADQCRHCRAFAARSIRSAVNCAGSPSAVRERRYICQIIMLVQFPPG